MADEKTDGMSAKDMLQQDLKTVDMMTRWRKQFAKGEHLFIKIVDKGMMPTVKIGDTVEVASVNAMDLRVGNVIFYRQSDAFIVRRIIQVNFNRGGQFNVKGDAVDNEEPVLAASQIIGKIISLDRDGEKIYLDKRSAALGKLKQLSGQKIGGDFGSSAPMDFLKNLLGKLVGALDALYQKICQMTDQFFDKSGKK
jgi:hypothetical protein